MSALGSRDNPFAVNRPAGGPQTEEVMRPLAEGPPSPAMPAARASGQIIPEDPFVTGPVPPNRDPFAPAQRAPMQPDEGFWLKPQPDPFHRPADMQFGGIGTPQRFHGPSGFGSFGQDEDFLGSSRELPGAGARFNSFEAQPDTMAERAFEVAALNPLVGAASPLLWLAARLNESSPPADPSAFRASVLDEVRRFGNAASAKGIAPGLVRVARYALCATIDDIVLNTAWGSHSEWTTQGLVSTLYQETWGGERFFDLLGQLHSDPSRTIDAMELMAICLAIGFVGKYRVVEGGAGQLIRLRGELYRTIRNVRGPYERDLAPGWAAIAAPYRPPMRMVWFWGLAGGLLAVVALVYVVLSLLLSNRIEAAVAAVAAVPPSAPVLVERPAIPDIPQLPPAPVAPVPAAPTQIERISAALPADIAQGQVEVVRDGDTVEIRLLGTSFPSGGASLSTTQEPLFRRIAAALNPELGAITVRGYTDNVPIAGTGRSNLTLSAERAASAAALLRTFIADPARVTSEGMGDADPIASNTTADGRARNRRVEFQIPAEDRLP